jgi:branched-chain amino acid transport system permease protein
LTGWAGQISLGKMALVAIGAAVSGWLTSTWTIDITLAIVGGAIAGSVAALIVGLPALRLQGLYLAVTTLAFALAVSSWLLNRRFFAWVPSDRLLRYPVFGRIDISTPTRYYVFTLVITALIIIGIRGIRHSRTGRVILALRDNDQAAQSFSIAPIWGRLRAFMISGAVAGAAGGLLAHLSQAFDPATYGVGASIEIFTATVVGGLGSLGGAVLGASFLRGTQWFIPSAEWRLLFSAFGVLMALLILPGGLISGVTALRDVLVRRLLGAEAVSALDHSTPVETDDQLRPGA